MLKNLLLLSCTNVLFCCSPDKGKPSTKSGKLKDNIGKILEKNSDLKSNIDDWCKNNNVTYNYTLSFIKENFSTLLECFPDKSEYVKNKEILFDIDKKINNGKIIDKKLLDDFKYAFRLLSQRTKKEGNRLKLYNVSDKKYVNKIMDALDIDDNKTDSDVDRLCMSYICNVRGKLSKDFPKFNNTVQDIKSRKNIDDKDIKILIGNTNENMTAIDRTCGCEFYHILDTIKFYVKEYNERKIDWNKKRLNEIVAIYNKNIGSFSSDVIKLKDTFIKRNKEDFKYLEHLDEFKKIIDRKTDYGKISEEDLKKAEEEFFKL